MFYRCILVPEKIFNYNSGKTEKTTLNSQPDNLTYQLNTQQSTWLWNSLVFKNNVQKHKPISTPLSMIKKTKIKSQNQTEPLLHEAHNSFLWCSAVESLGSVLFGFAVFLTVFFFSSDATGFVLLAVFDFFFSVVGVFVLSDTLLFVLSALAFVWDSVLFLDALAFGFSLFFTTLLSVLLFSVALGCSLDVLVFTVSFSVVLAETVPSCSEGFMLMSISVFWTSASTGLERFFRSSSNFKRSCGHNTMQQG